MVTKVDFYIDGRFWTTDAILPYKLGWNTAKAANGSHRIKAKAYDMFGNINTVEVTVGVKN